MAFHKPVGILMYPNLIRFLRGSIYPPEGRKKIRTEKRRWVSE